MKIELVDMEKEPSSIGTNIVAVYDWVQQNGLNTYITNIMIVQKAYRGYQYQFIDAVKNCKGEFQILYSYKQGDQPLSNIDNHTTTGEQLSKLLILYKESKKSLFLPDTFDPIIELVENQKDIGWYKIHISLSNLYRVNDKGKITQEIRDVSGTTAIYLCKEDKNYK